MGDAALFLRFVARSTCEPHADAHRSNVRHPLGKKPETVRKHVADDEWLRHECVWESAEVSARQQPVAICRKPLTDRELEEQAYDNTDGSRASQSRRVGSAGSRERARGAR